MEEFKNLLLMCATILVLGFLFSFIKMAYNDIYDNMLNSLAALIGAFVCIIIAAKL